MRPQNKKKIGLLFLYPLFLFVSSCASLDIKPVGHLEKFVREADERRLWTRSEEEQAIIDKSGIIYQTY